MIDIRKIDISKIRSDGKYVDLSIPVMFMLSKEEIISLRRYHGDPNIARDFDFGENTKEVINPPTRNTSRDTRPQVPQNTPRVTNNSRKKPMPKKKHFAMARDKDKYNKGKHKTKNNPIVKYGTRLIVGGLVIILTVGFLRSISVPSTSIDDSYIETSAVGVATKNEFDKDNIILINPGEHDVDDEISNEQSQESPEQEADLDEEISSQRAIINRYCNIYQVNSDVVYDKIAELTDNFSSEDYLANYHIDGVTCKQREVYASSEEEILLYTVRCIKQLPERLGVDTSNLYINNGYTSGTDYNKQISDISRVMGLDRCLVYAICRSECGFNSNLFLNINNPAGLKDSSGSWWAFDTKEEGFIEICAEIIKYYGRIDKPLSDTSYDTLAQVRDIHAPLSDGNDYWLGNVWSIYQDAKANEREMFGQYDHTSNLGM